MKKIPVKTLYLLLVIGIGLVGLGIGSTYAIFTASAEINDPITLNSSLEHTSDIIETIEVEVPSGETISTTLNVTNSSGTTLNYVIWYLDEDYDIQLGTESGTPSGSVTSGSNKSIGIKIKNYENENVTVILGISSNSGSVVLGNGMTAVPSEKLKSTLVDTISNLYNNSSKTVVTNIGIEYNVATSVGLMNDRLGGTTTDYNAGNIRYYGATPNNYVYFNCDSDTNTSTCQKWRIIGLFKDIELSDGTKKDMVKITMNIGERLSWDQSSSSLNSGNGINEWSQADLMKLLNSGYESEAIGGSLYWNSGIGTCYGQEAWNSFSTFECDFTSVGLKTNSHGFIKTVKWNLGGYNSTGVYPNEIYGYERGTSVNQNPSDGVKRTTIWSGNVALPYPSDYGYAADLSNCNYQLSNYSNCNLMNWMLYEEGFGIYNGFCFLTPDDSNAFNVWCSNENGTVQLYSASDIEDLFPVAYPTIYLDSQLIVNSGDGTEAYPYVLSKK